MRYLEKCADTEAPSLSVQYFTWIGAEVLRLQAK